jgi:hypothetical protein
MKSCFTRSFWQAKATLGVAFEKEKLPSGLGKQKPLRTRRFWEAKAASLAGFGKGTTSVVPLGSVKSAAL